MKELPECTELGKNGGLQVQKGTSMKYAFASEKPIFAFDLDGTITTQETLPILARELDLMNEMEQLTRLTLEGKIDFEASFRMRYHLLREIPLQKIRQIMEEVPMDEKIAGFIREHAKECAIVTGNLDVWVQPLITKLGCMAYSSTSRLGANGELQLEAVLDKAETIRWMKMQGHDVIAIGDSVNDIPMFQEADVAIAYGGVHPLVNRVAAISDYVVENGEALCHLLEGVQTMFRERNYASVRPRSDLDK